MLSILNRISLEYFYIPMDVASGVASCASGGRCFDPNAARMLNAMQNCIKIAQIRIARRLFRICPRAGIRLEFSSKARRLRGGWMRGEISTTIRLGLAPVSSSGAVHPAPVDLRNLFSGRIRYPACHATVGSSGVRRRHALWQAAKPFKARQETSRARRRFFERRTHSPLGRARSLCSISPAPQRCAGRGWTAGRRPWSRPTPRSSVAIMDVDKSPCAAPVVKHALRRDIAPPRFSRSVNSTRRTF